MTVNLIDGSNIFFIAFAILEQKKYKLGLSITEDDYPEFVALFAMKIQLFMTANYNIVTFEGSDSTAWRRELYPEYKANRNEKKASDNYKHVGPLMDIVKEKLLPAFPCKVIACDKCEGDDCIFALAEGFSHLGHQVTIVSSDEDLTQMCNFWPRTVHVLHPIKKQLREAKKDIIQEKMYVGDVSDNIKYKKGLGPATYKELKVHRAVFKKFVSTQEDIDRLNNIHKIVDLRCFPLEYRQNIIKTYNEATWYAKTMSEYMPFKDIFGVEGMTANTCKKRVNTWVVDNLETEEIKLPEPHLTYDTSDVWFDYGD